ncbi:MAG: PKD domain-containing protein [Bacteroidales bacterium]|nr:PKD domain-containing protein [Bacteroidales bacterium]
MTTFSKIKACLLAAMPVLVLLIGFSHCKKDPYKGWTFYTESPPPPEIVELRSVISNCEPPYPVTFFQQTNNLIGNVNYLWDFGDGQTSTDQNPHHIYSVPGDYEVMFVVSNEVGADTAYLDMSELSQSSISVVADFSYTHFNNNNYAPNKVIFNNNSSGANQFYWYFDDGDQSNIANPEHIFQDYGTYTVKLKGTCTNGDFHETTRSIFVMPAPQRVFIDSINLMLPSSYKNDGVFIDLYHNTTLIGTTITKTPSSYPVKFKRPNDFLLSYFFDYVQFTNNEVFEFWIMKENGADPPIFLYKIVLASIAIQDNFYPKTFFYIKTVPALPDVFIDLYLSY